MLTFEKTTLYKNSVKTLKSIFIELQNHTSPKSEATFNHITKKILIITETIAQITKPQSAKQRQTLINKATNTLHELLTNLNYLDLSPAKNKEITNKIESIEASIQAFPTSQQKVLILMARIGHGHLNAAKATKEAIEHLYGYDYDIEIIDFLEVISSRFKKTTEALFIGGSKYLPQFNRFFFESTDHENLIKIFDKINYPFLAKKLTTFFEEKKPNIIISTFPAWDNVSHEICKKQCKPPKFINIITDSINIHTTWVLAKHDYHIVPNQDTAKSLLEMNVPKEKIKTLGFPIRLKYLNKTSKQNFCEKIKIPANKPVFLYLAMADRTSTAIKHVQEMASFKNHLILVVTGRNQKLLPKLKSKTDAPNVHFFGWVDNLHEFIQHSEIIITKAGGSTVMEAIAMQKPLIITKVIAGQEEGNAELITKHNLGATLSDKNPNLTTAIKYIQKNKRQIDKNLSAQSAPEASLKIAEFIHEL